MIAVAFAATIIVLQVGAGFAYLWVKHPRLALYWWLVAAVNVVVTDWR